MPEPANVDSPDRASAQQEPASAAAPAASHSHLPSPSPSTTHRSSSVASPSREGTPPPLPPRPQLGLLAARPSTSHSPAAPSRPQLVSKPTTHVALTTTQAIAGQTSDDSPSPASSKPRNLPLNLSSHNTSDAEDSASVRSCAPTALGDGESILGEVLAPNERSEQQKTLLRSLGHRFVDTEALSLFPPDPHFEAAFETEFDSVDAMQPDGSNQGQTHPSYTIAPCADAANRTCHELVAR